MKTQILFGLVLIFCAFSAHGQDETTTTEVPETTLPPAPVVECEDVGKFSRHPSQCNIFYLCDGVENRPFKCPRGLVFDLTINACNYKNLVDCSS